MKKVAEILCAVLPLPAGRLPVFIIHALLLHLLPHSYCHHHHLHIFLILHFFSFSHIILGEYFLSTTKANVAL